jgi:hypothetical protein
MVFQEAMSTSLVTRRILRPSKLTTRLSPILFCNANHVIVPHSRTFSSKIVNRANVSLSARRMFSMNKVTRSINVSLNRLGNLEVNSFFGFCRDVVVSWISIVIGMIGIILFFISAVFAIVFGVYGIGMLLGEGLYFILRRF